MGRKRTNSSWIVTVHDKSTEGTDGVVHLRGDEDKDGTRIEIRLVGSTALVESFHEGTDYEVGIAGLYDRPAPEPDKE